MFVPLALGCGTEQITDEIAKKSETFCAYRRGGTHESWVNFQLLYINSSYGTGVNGQTLYHVNAIVTPPQKKKKCTNWIYF